jgi:putative DNA methylase
MTEYRKKMIEVAMPLEAINAASEHEKKPGIGAHPRSIQQWWARRPLASCRAVLFGQLVDDPSSWPDRFSTEEAQDAERQRLFRILEELVLWENSNNTRVLNAARKEIAQSLARNRVADGEGTERDDEVLAESAGPEVVNAYLGEVAPPVHDPFAGGGSIPLEAQRLGLRAIATDLNPVAVLINKALIEIPPKFAGRAPVHPKADKRTNWSSAEGLAEDVRRYGEWMRDEAKKRIGHLYPEVDLPEEHGGGKATVIAWLWARTVESPDPAFKGVHVPLVSNFFLSTKKGKETWVEPVIEGRDYRFEIRTGKPSDPAEIKKGTKLGRGANFRCVMSGSPIEPTYIKNEGKAGRMGQRLMAIVAEGNRKRIYLPPTHEQVAAADAAAPTWAPEQELPKNPRWFSPPDYGMPTYGDLFTPRQLVALTTFSDLVLEARDKAIADARAAGWDDDGRGLEDRGGGATAYGDSIAVYLSCAIARLADHNCGMSAWLASNEQTKNLFRRQAIPMVWDFSESNVLGSKAINLQNMVRIVEKAVLSAQTPGGSEVAGTAAQANALTPDTRGSILCTDPPYYDNIGYADLSDFFHVWHRRTLRYILPGVFSTILTPKEPELIASPYRHGGKDEAEAHFTNGMEAWLSAARGNYDLAVAPIAIYYAFKQSESTDSGETSTGWATFLQGVLDAKLQVVSTLPARTESGIKVGIVAGKGSNMLASSIVLVCRPRSADAHVITRGDFRRLLLNELPAAIHDLQKGNIAPVDMSQASIGPGMAVFSRHSKVIEADGSAMSVRTALQIINEIVDEVRGGEEMDLDAETRFAITWFETHGFVEGPYGDSATLATAHNVAVESVARAGLLHTAAGKTRLLIREQLPEDWDPASDTTLTVWECTQHLIKRLEEKGEEAASSLLRAIGPRAEAARTLAYRLYTHCERKGDAEAWPELERLASQNSSTAQPASSQAGLFEGNN